MFIAPEVNLDKGRKMKRNLIVYCVTLLFIIGSVVFVKSAYSEWLRYSRLTRISNKVLTIYQDLQVQITKASMLHPELVREASNPKTPHLFFADSAAIASSLYRLKNTVADTVNEKIVKALTERTVPELAWLISKPVADTVGSERPGAHVANFGTIDSLINAGKKRTQFLIAYRSGKIDESFEKLITQLTVLVGIYMTILTLAFWSLYRERRIRKKHEAELSVKEEFFQRTLDGMLEGEQIHDFDWKYTYVNDALVRSSTYPKEELLGKSLFEKYPGIEQTELFKVLDRCMKDRLSKQMETEFVFPNGSKAQFELSIQPVPQGLFILSVDITEQKKSREDLIKKNRLYAFLSAINKTIVHSETEEELAQRVAEISMNIGQFSLAYLGLLDEKKHLQIKCIAGNTVVAERVRQMTGLDINAPSLQNIPTVKVLKTGERHLNNDMQGDPALLNWRKEFAEHGICSSISLPLKISGEVVGVLGFHAGVKDFFDTDEVALLDEAASDISFAFGNFKKAALQKEIEMVAAKNDQRYRALIEKSNDLKTLTNKEGKLIYCSPSVLNTFGYSEEDFIGKAAMDFFHPEDLPQIMHKRAGIMGIPRATYLFQCRLLHKNGTWIWCEGTATNFLNEPAIEAIVTNFIDITARRKLEFQREFDKSNLHALINNTKDLMWSVDRSFRLITSNQPFDEALELRLKRSVAKGEQLLNRDLGEEAVRQFGNYYERAFNGESFTVTRENTSPQGTWSEISFYPIKKNDEVIGTACFLKDITERKKNVAEKEGLIKQLTQHNQDLRQFAYITSHNLRGPVANLLGLCNLLDGYSFDDPVLNKILGGIKTATLTFDETIRDLANVLIARENPSVQVEVVHLEEVFEKVKNSLLSPLNSFTHEILCDFKEATRIEFNKVYMESVFVNLLSNAIKYRKEETPLKIEVRTTVENGHVKLAFSDNGIGFDSETQKDKVFQLYQRFHTHREGKGLGLFLIKTQIESLGGSIEVTSKPDDGTNFMLRFKRVKS